MSVDNDNTEDVLDRKRSLTPKDKKLIITIVVTVIVIFGLWVVVKLTNPQKNLETKPTLRPLSLSTDLMAEDQFEQFKNEVINFKEMFNSL